jgi:hypothetical protein
MKNLTKLVFLFSILSVLMISTSLISAMKEHHEMQVKMPADFEKMKSLLGEWEAVSTEDGKETKSLASYELTSNGTAIVEKIFKGMPYEMTTVYYAEGTRLGMTHYCALGNHPKMMLKEARKDKLYFEMNGKDGIISPMEAHMHALTIMIKDNNNVQQDWVYFENGKKTKDTVINFTRKM